MLALVALAFSACKKIKTTEPLGDQGQTLVKILGAGNPYEVISDPINFVSTPYTLTKGVVDIRRDVPNNFELNRTMTIVIKDDTAAVHAADPSYEILPAAWYTLTTSDNVTKVGGSGGTFTFTMKPGEFAKQIYINIPNATLLDPSKLYGLGFTIASADADAKYTDARTLVVQVGAKNAYDGIYTIVGGNVQRYTAGVPEAITPGGLNGPIAGNPDVIMATIGAFTCAIPPVSTTGGLFWAFGAGSMVAGVDGIQVTVDPSTNKTTGISLGNASFSNWAGKPNFYDPATKTFNMAWRWNPTGNTREYELVMKYKGPR